MHGQESAAVASEPAVRYLPGRWVVIAKTDTTGEIVLLADLDPSGPVVSACWDAVEHGCSVESLLGVILREGLRSVPNFAIAGRTGATVRVLLSGKARAEVAVLDAEPIALDAAGSPTWVEEQLEQAQGVRLVADDLVDDGVAGLPLVRGVALASTVTLGALPRAVPAAAAAGSASRPAPDAAPAPEIDRATADGLTIRFADESGLISSLPWRLPDSLPSEAADEPITAGEPTTVLRIGKPPEGAGGAPMVPAAACPNHHLGPPHESVCRVCGAPVPNQDAITVPRPVLGVLHLSTGDMVPLDRDVVLGRAPSTLHADPEGRPHLVRLPSPGNDISRNHVCVRLEGWHVQAVDLGSTNGTLVTMPGQRPVRLRPHDAFTIVPGTVVDLAGEVQVRFDVTG